MAEPKCINDENKNDIPKNIYIANIIRNNFMQQKVIKK
jgi:hypothetical protein